MMGDIHKRVETDIETITTPEGDPLEWQVIILLPYRAMMTLSNGNIFRVTGHLCGEFTGDR